MVIGAKPALISPAPVPALVAPPLPSPTRISFELFNGYFMLFLRDTRTGAAVATLQVDGFHCREPCALQSQLVMAESAAAHPGAMVVYISWLSVVKACRGRKLGISLVVMLQTLIAALRPGKPLVLLLAVMPEGELQDPNSKLAIKLADYYRMAGFVPYESTSGAEGVPWMIKDCRLGGVAYPEGVEERARGLMGTGGAAVTLSREIAGFLPYLVPLPAPKKGPSSKKK